MGLVKGIHHVSMKCVEEEYEKTVTFYRDVLGLSVARSWEGGIMFDTGNGLLEIFGNGEGSKETGAVRHFALATDDVDACVKAVREAGYEVFIEPRDSVIPSQPPFPLRMAFAYGPLGEQIEFFCER